MIGEELYLLDPRLSTSPFQITLPSFAFRQATDPKSPHTYMRWSCAAGVGTSAKAPVIDQRTLLEASPLDSSETAVSDSPRAYGTITIPSSMTGDAIERKNPWL